MNRRAVARTALFALLAGAIALAYSYLGYLGHEVFAGGDDLAQKILFAVALMAGVAFLPRLLRRVRTPPGQLKACWHGTS